jgi:hypothetical protein
MHTKLTLRLDDSLIARAKIWSEQRGISLSQAVAALFSQLPVKEAGATELTAWTRQFIGVAGPSRSDEEVRELLRDRALRKHG